MGRAIAQPHAAADDANALQPFDMGCNAGDRRNPECIRLLFFALSRVVVAPTIWKMILTVTLFSVITRNGQGDSLAVFVDAQNDELTGFCLFFATRELRFPSW